jgi:HPt (histidine-containing phosphotransfer) domain-containing protein
MITDLTYLNSMSEGNADIVKGMVDIFIDQARGYIIDFKTHLNNENYIALGKLAHKARSSMAIMGVDDLVNDLKRLEILTHEGKEEEEYPRIVEKFTTVCQLAIDELVEVYSKL